MNRLDKVKKEISAMSLDDFMKHFVVEGTRDYICSEIKVSHAQCINHQQYNCTECIKAYLEGEVKENDLL